MVEERAVQRSRRSAGGIRPIRRRPRGVPQLVGDVQPRQRAHAVDAARVAQRLVVRRLQIGGRQRRFADVVRVIRGRRSGRPAMLAVRLAEAERAVVELQRAVGVHQARRTWWGRCRSARSLPRNWSSSALKNSSVRRAIAFALRKFAQDAVAVSAASAARSRRRARSTTDGCAPRPVPRSPAARTCAARCRRAPGPDASRARR